MNIEKITIASGYTCDVDLDVLDDMDAFDDLLTMQDPSAASADRIRATNRVFLKMIGPEQDKELRAHLRELDGERVTIKAYQGAINEIFGMVNNNKKK